MASITTRAGKGTPLTNTEVDANFTNLNAEVTPARPTIRPSLLLDFANSKTVDERITFTRSTTATYYDAQGVLKYAQPDQPRIDHDPATGECKGLLIEEQRTNFLPASSDYAQTGVWTNTSCGVERGFLAPDGTASASRLTAGAAASFIYSATTTSLTAGSNYTLTWYVKQGTSTYFQIGVSNGGSFYAFIAVRWSDMQVTPLVSGIASVVSSSVTNVGGGWYRASVTVQYSSTTSVRAYVVPSSAASIVTSSVGQTLYVFGAQLELGSFATSYTPSTTTFTSRASSATYFDSTGVLRTAGVNQPRYGYGYDSASGKWVSQGLVLESAATNMLAYGNLQNATGVRASLTQNLSSAPDGSLSAASFSETTDSGEHASYVSYGTTIGSVYTNSIYVKGGNNRQWVVLFNGWSGSRVWFDIVNGVVGSSEGGQVLSASITRVPSANGPWWRLSYTYTANNTTSYLQIGLASANGTYSYAGSTSNYVYIWGAQAESGYVATSYIPTYGATATRAADVSSSAATTRVADSAVIRGLGFDGWYRQDEGTSVMTASSYASNYAAWRSLWEFNRYTDQSAVRQSVGVTSGGANSAYLLPYSGNPVYGITSGGYLMSGTSAATTAFAYKHNDSAVSGAGATPIVDTDCSMTTLIDHLMLGNDNEGRRVHGHIKRFAYYPKRLSNTELQAITA